MYFNFLPAIKYDQKPISYPFSESDYVVAKNFFRRYKISETAFSSATYFNKYALLDGQRLDQIAEAVYGNPNYDWIIVLTNNMINTQYDLPMSETELRKHIESQYDNPYYDYHHYEIISDDKQVEQFGKVLMPGGTVVDETFYNNRRTLTADVFPDLSPTSKTITYSNNYIFSSDQFDNSFVTSRQNANFEQYGTGLGEDGGFILYYPKRGAAISDGYLRFRGDGERFAQFAQVDATHLQSFTFKGKFGNDFNGGEEADLADEILKLQYRNDIYDPWTDIDIIIPLGMLQYFDYDPQPDPAGQDRGYGGTGRPAGVYENVTIYYGDGSSIGNATTPTSARATVTIDDLGQVIDIKILDRGEGILNSTIELYIRNEDIGNGYYYNNPLAREEDKDYLFDLYLFAVSTRQTPTGVQYGRYSEEPYAFTVQVPEAAKTETTEFRLFQINNSGVIFDQYAIQEVRYDFEQTYSVDTDINYIRIDDDNYIIEGVAWTKVDDVWYRVTETGFRYHDGGSTIEIAGNELSRPVTQFEYEQTENEKKREIYILKPDYVDTLVEDFRKAALYKKSSDYVSNRLKSTGT
jgi:hypothetical protein|tara:strand:+ start:1743 stop:3479 length:1737 start_codon:yes stop_codon:yes gene_type:complete